MCGVIPRSKESGEICGVASRQMFQVLAKNTHLKQLNLENNNLSVEDARALARTLIVPTMMIIYFQLFTSGV